jgi:rhodanese-related sulfurtransferase
VATVLLNNGYQNVTNVMGGFSAWEKANLPIER